jgi:ribose transport system ATP-binding protein
LDSSARLLAIGMSKSYGATVALDDVSLNLRPGQVHALLGENGAGKSTLVKILSGVVRAGDGTMRLNGEDYTPHSISDARKSGVATAFQELSLPPNLSVAHALLLPKLEKGALGLVSSSRCNDRAEEILRQCRLTDLSPLDIVGRLSLAQRQRLEIARAMSHAHSLLILDEPTAALTDVNWLFDLVRERTSDGLSVLYISHRLAEVRQLCSRATVLRNGRTVADVDLSDSTNADIFRLMVGRNEGASRRSTTQVENEGAVILQVKGAANASLQDISFNLHHGEILGVAGLEGQGQRELFRALVGLGRLETGSIHVKGREVHIRDPRGALALGLAFVPEERKVDGIFVALTTAANVTLPILSRVSQLGVIWPALERVVASRKSEAVELSPRYLDFRIGDLSGGNQQKALLARAMATGAHTLLLYDPTRGVDVGTKEAIYVAIRAFARSGGAVLFYSSELPELTELADRCLVVYDGRVHAEFIGSEIVEDAMVAALTGHAHSDESVGQRVVA